MIATLSDEDLARLTTLRGIVRHINPVEDPVECEG
jgi:hypothetical protein